MHRHEKREKQQKNGRVAPQPIKRIESTSLANSSMKPMQFGSLAPSDKFNNSNYFATPKQEANEIEKNEKQNYEVPVIEETAFTNEELEDIKIVHGYFDYLA